MSDPKEIITMRRMAWQRAKGNMMAFLETFWPEYDPKNGINTECVVCGNNIPSGIYPPVCPWKRNSCRSEWDIETGFNRWVREYEKRNKLDE